MTSEGENIEADFSQEELEELRARGYEILQKVGEGNTRPVYLARYKRGEVEKLRVVKPLKLAIEIKSPTTKINMSKRDVNLAEVVASNQIQHPYIAEVVASNQIQHPYIAEVVDTFNLGGRRVNVEPYYEGTDLETLVKTSGPVREETFVRIFNQALDAFLYLHEEKAILHRDIKPSNILVRGNGEIKVTDLQNAANLFNIHELSMPTRGGTPYTHPDLINALLGAAPASASKRTEVYALGASMYYALTGEVPLDYIVMETEKGRQIEIGRESLMIGCVQGGINLDRIVLEQHETMLKIFLAKVPKKYRNLVYRCLTTDSKKAFCNVRSLKQEFDRLNSDVYGRIREGVVKGAKIALPILALGGILAGGIIGSIAAGKREPTPTMAEIMRDADYRHFSLEDQEGFDRLYAIKVLDRDFSNMERDLSRIPKKEDDFIDNMTGLAERVHRMDKRLVSSWLRACYLCKDAKEDYDKKGEKRLPVSFVPENFAKMSALGIEREDLDDNEQVAMGVQYLKLCLGPNGNVTDVFARYFASTEDINSAIARTGGLGYFPRVVADGDDKGGRIDPGYYQILPGHEERLINMATALYMITDKDGKVDLSKIPSGGELFNARSRPDISLPPRKSFP